jgi:hypothetical protein
LTVPVLTVWVRVEAAAALAGLPRVAKYPTEPAAATSTTTASPASHG